MNWYNSSDLTSVKQLALLVLSQWLQLGLPVGPQPCVKGSCGEMAIQQVDIKAGGFSEADS